MGVEVREPSDPKSLSRWFTHWFVLNHTKYAVIVLLCKFGPKPSGGLDDWKCWTGKGLGKAATDTTSCSRI